MFEKKEKNLRICEKVYILLNNNFLPPLTDLLQFIELQSAVQGVPRNIPSSSLIFNSHTYSWLRKKIAGFHNVCKFLKFKIKIRPRGNSINLRQL